MMMLIMTMKFVAAFSPVSQFAARQMQRTHTLTIFVSRIYFDTCQTTTDVTTTNTTITL